jgi:hypothetical protein
MVDPTNIGNLFVALAIEGGTPKKIIAGNVIAEPLLASVFISPLRSPQNKKRIIAEISIFVIFLHANNVLKNAMMHFSFK